MVVVTHWVNGNLVHDSFEDGEGVELRSYPGDVFHVVVDSLGRVLASFPFEQEVKFKRVPNV
jgi:hypothetical protein